MATSSLYPDLYNDVFGPPQQPFSSSHTAAPGGLGYLANSLLGEEVRDIKIHMDPSSSLYGAIGYMNAGIAMLSGASGHLPNDKIMFEIHEYLKTAGISHEYVVEEMKEGNDHSAVKFVLTGKSGKKAAFVGISLGGGRIRSVAANGYPFESSGDTYCALFFDREAALSFDEISKKVAARSPVVEKGVTTTEDKGNLLWYKISEYIPPEELQQISGGVEAAAMRPVTPIVLRPERKPQLFSGFTQWRRLAEERNEALWQVVVAYQAGSSSLPDEAVIEHMMGVIAPKMHRVTHAVFEEGLDAKDNLPFTGHYYRQWTEYMKEGKHFTGSAIGKAIGYGFACQTGIPGLEFVPGPMGAGGGLIYSSLSAVMEEGGYSREDIKRALFVAGGVGLICFTRTTPGGIPLGCAGEQGISMAMAAAAITEMLGGTAEQVETAASTALQISIGWPCDPTPGAKNMPCVMRSMVNVSMAVVLAEIARSGRPGVFPFDEVVDAVDEWGRRYSRRATGGRLPVGLDCTPTSRALEKSFTEWFEARRG